MNNLRHKLEEHGVEYEIIRHERPAKTAREGAELLGIDIGQTAPVLIVKNESGKFYSLIISGSRGRIDLENTGSPFGLGALEMASPKEVRQVTGYSVGSVSLVLPLPCILDRRLFGFDFVYGGTGEPGTTLKLPPHALERINDIFAYLD